MKELLLIIKLSHNKKIIESKTLNKKKIPNQKKKINLIVFLIIL